MLVSTVGALVVSVVALVFSVGAFIYDGERAKPEVDIVGYAKAVVNVAVPQQNPRAIEPTYNVYVVMNSGGEAVTLTSMMSYEFRTPPPADVPFTGGVWIGDDCEVSGELTALQPNETRVYLMTSSWEPTTILSSTADGTYLSLEVPLDNTRAYLTAASHITAAEVLLRECGGGLLPAGDVKWWMSTVSSG